LELDTTKAKASFIRWSRTHPVLVVGTDKGSLIFYNKKNQKKIPTVGKHAKKVVTGDWNKEGLLSINHFYNPKLLEGRTKFLQFPTTIQIPFSNQFLLRWSPEKSNGPGQRLTKGTLLKEPSPPY